MKNTMLIVATFAAFLAAGCSKSASVTGESQEKLSLVKPAAVTVHRGGMSKADIQIKRTDLAGDVAIQFKNLPKGVEVVESDNRIVGEKGTYTLRASDTADLVENYASEVTATSGPGNLSVSQVINVSVKAVQ